LEVDMLASIHLADVGLRTALKALRAAPSPGSTPGLRYATTVAAASFGGPVLAAPQPGRVGLIALWDDDAALDGFLSGHPLAAALAGGWHVRLTTVHAHEYHRARGSDVVGSWPGLTGDITDPAPPDGPTVVLTLARTRPSQFLRFARASLHAARPLASSPGLIWASALARPPIVATCSLWTSPAALEAYAYSAGSGHRRAMAADQQRPFHQSGVFFRFHPTRSAGQLDGRNPLAADWMTSELAARRSRSPADG
jgi:hypothetical protein